MGKKRKIQYLLISFLMVFSRVAAQIQDSQGLLGQLLSSYSGSLGSLSGYAPRELLFDAATFLFVWILTYTISKAFLKLAAEKDPTEVAEKIKKTALGGGSSSVTSSGGSKPGNLWMLINLLMLLSLGPYLIPFLKSVRNLIVGSAGIGLGFLILIVLGGGVLGMIYLMGGGLKGAAGAGNMAGSSAKSFINSKPVQWGKEKGKEASDRIRKGVGSLDLGITNNLINQYANTANAMGYMVCDECGKWHDPSSNNRGDPCTERGEPWCTNGTIG